MVSVSIEGDRLVVRLSGWQAFLALRRTVDVPIRNVVSASTGTVTSLRPNGIRLPGTYLPGVIAAGSYWWKDRGWSFWSVRHPEKAVDIRLENAKLHRIVVEVADPYATAAMIEDAVRSMASNRHTSHAKEEEDS